MTKEKDLLEINSVKVKSNIANLFTDTELDETNSASNIAGYQSLISKLVKKTQSQSNLKHFCSVIDATTPKGKIPVFTETILGSSGDNSSTYIFKIEEDQPYAVDATITGDTSSATGTVLYVEDNLILVDVTSGDFELGETTDTSTATISEIFDNEWAVGVLLKDIATSNTTETGESAENIKEVQFLLKMVEIECTTKSLNFGYTLESIQDLMSTTGATRRWAENLIINSARRVIDMINKQKVISFMKSNARVRGTIDLTDVVGNNGGIESVYASIYARINHSIGAIGTNTGIEGSYSVLASSDAYAGIMTYLKGDLVLKDGYVLLPNGAKLIEDGYSLDNYVLVTLADLDTNNSAVFYTPYSYSIESVLDGDTLQEVSQIKVRSDVVNNQIIDLVDSKNYMMEYSQITGFHSTITF